MHMRNLFNPDLSPFHGFNSEIPRASLVLQSRKFSRFALGSFVKFLFVRSLYFLFFSLFDALSDRKIATFSWPVEGQKGF